MRRFLLVPLDALQFQRLHGGGLPLDLLLQVREQFALRNDHAVQLFDLVLKVRHQRFEFVHTMGIFFGHAGSLPMALPKVEPAGIFWAGGWAAR